MTTHTLRRGSSPFIVTVAHAGQHRLDSVKSPGRLEELRTDIMGRVCATQLNASLVKFNVHRSCIDVNLTPRNAYVHGGATRFATAIGNAVRVTLNNY